MIAPSGPFDVASFERGVTWLRERYVVSHRDDVTERSGFLAGGDERRASELLEALADPAVDAIVVARGGHGATRILPRIATSAIAAGGKVLIGFSDVTALHAAWARAGLRSIHGPMVATLGRADARLRARWIEAVEGVPPAPVHRLRALARGTAVGPLVGGNLAVLSALVGTPFLPSMAGAIVFLEDVNEAPYRVDRMLTSLRNAGVLSEVAGIALGAFTSGPPDPAVEAVLAERLGDLGVPVALGLPSGHVDDNLELPLGAPVRIDAHADASVTFLEAAVARDGAGAVG